MDVNKIFKDAAMEVIKDRLQFNKEHYGEDNRITEIIDLRSVGIEKFDITGTTFFVFTVKTDYIMVHDKKVTKATWRLTIDNDGIFGLKLLEVADGLSEV